MKMISSKQDRWRLSIAVSQPARISSTRWDAKRSKSGWKMTSWDVKVVTGDTARGLQRVLRVIRSVRDQWRVIIIRNWTRRTRFWRTTTTRSRLTTAGRRSAKAVTSSETSWTSRLGHPQEARQTTTEATTWGRRPGSGSWKKIGQWSSVRPPLTSSSKMPARTRGSCTGRRRRTRRARRRTWSGAAATVKGPDRRKLYTMWVNFLSFAIFLSFNLFSFL